MDGLMVTLYHRTARVVSLTLPVLVFTSFRLYRRIDT